MTKPPAIFVFNEAEAIDTVAGWVAKIGEKLTAASSRAFLEEGLCDLLRRGAVSEIQIVEDANAGDDIADSALRKVYSEKVNHHETPSIHLTSYALGVVERNGPSKTRGKSGPPWWKNWRRNWGVVCLVFMTCREFNINPTRNREQRRRQEPSGSSLVSAGLGRHRINMDERTIENLWCARQGHIVTFLTQGQI